MASSPSTSSATSPNESQGSNANRSSFQKYLTNCRSLYSCIYCRTHLANHDELVSRSFQGNHGRAYLFKSVINVSCGPPVQRDLTTGPHAVADIFCADCERTLGWKYEKAYVESQKYKEGKYIIELAHVVRENRHLELDKGEIYFSRNERRRTSSGTSQNSSSSSTTSSSSSSSKLPPSPSNCHSPSNRSFKGRGEASSSAHPFHVDDEEEELMFPFYEDLLACRSSNLSLSHHQRMRRSLYLDSTPYDWKYSTTSSSAGQSGGTATTKIASSLDSSSDLSPSKSSSSDNSLDNRQISYHISNSINQICQQPDASIAGCCQNQRVNDKQDHCDNNNIKFNEGENNDNLDGDKNKVDGDDDVDDDDDEETQFEFEEDKPHSSLSDNAQLRKMQCDRLDGNCVIGAQNSSNLNIDNENGEAEAEKQHSDEDSDTSLSSSNGASGSNDSVILDDETFYDCYTDHGISNSVPLSGSTSTLKQ